MRQHVDVERVRTGVKPLHALHYASEARGSYGRSSGASDASAAAYASTQVLPNAKSRFVLSSSGHIAGIVNHPDRKKYGYWVSDETPTDLKAWRAGATAQEGSWWPDWAGWLVRRSGKKIDAADSFPKSIPRLEPAPGRYVKE